MLAMIGTDIHHTLENSTCDPFKFLLHQYVWPIMYQYGWENLPE